MPYESSGFQRAQVRAETYAKDRRKVGQLLKDALVKAYNHRSQLQHVWPDLMSLYRMLKAWSHGEYKFIPWKTIVLSVAAIIYFLNPLDLTPDFIPGVGLIDDAVVLSFVVNSIKKELDRFLRWEQENEV